jgi:hypothetical protein
MSKDLSSADATATSGAATVALTLEVTVPPVADVDREVTERLQGRV